MTYDFTNFHHATAAVWEPCEAPSRPADFVSASRSEYWDMGDHVIRRADHWGEHIASCNWWLAGQASPEHCFLSAGVGRVAYADMVAGAYVNSNGRGFGFEQLATLPNAGKVAGLAEAIAECVAKADEKATLASLVGRVIETKTGKRTIVDVGNAIYDGQASVALMKEGGKRAVWSRVAVAEVLAA